MVCPNCGSENVVVQMQEVGSKTKKHGNGLGGIAHNTVRATMGIATLGMSNLVIKKAKGGERTKVTTQKICLCQSCGHDWPFQEEKKGLFKK